MIIRIVKRKGCTFPMCPKSRYAKQLCVGHYYQKLNGKELAPLKHKRKRGSCPLQNIKKVKCNSPNVTGPCHIAYLYQKDNKGYIRFQFKGKMVRSHRYIWRIKRGKIPKGFGIDHQCRNRACCNIKHLRLVTHTVNALENSISPFALNAQKTHCKRGHKFTEENTYAKPNSKSRECKTCKADYSKERYERSKPQGVKT